MNLPHRACWLAVIILAARAAAAPTGMPETDEYLVRQWQTEEGLPQNSVTSIAQTRDGYLWLGTFNGLVRFDGIRFQTYTSARTEGLASDAVNHLLEDRQARLWIATDGGGVSSLTGQRFTHYTYSGANHAGVDVVSRLAEGTDGTIWVGTDGGLFRIREPGGMEPDPEAWAAGVRHVNDLCVDDAGRLWIVSQDRLYVRQDGKVLLDSTRNGVNRIVRAKRAGVWLSGGTNSLILHGTESPALYPHWRQPAAACQLEAANGDVWMSCQGLTRLRQGQRKDVPLAGPSGPVSVVSVAEDREGNLWVGTNGDGLLQLRPRLIRTITMRDGLPGDDVVALLRDPQDGVWIGGFDVGIGVWQEGRYRGIPGLDPRVNNVYAMTLASDGTLWLGTRESRLLSWKDGRLASSEYLPGEGSRVLFSDKSGALWVGSRRDGVFERQPGRTNHYGPAQGLSHGFVTALAQDREGSIWVGTKQGLNRIARGTIRRFGRGDGLPTDCIHTLYLDAEGLLWVGTAGGGLCLRQGERFHAVSAAQGLPNDVVAQLLEDDRGNLWIGSNAGLFRVSRRQAIDCALGKTTQLQCQRFGRHEGVPNPEFAGSFQPSACRTKDGQLWFSTVGGIVVVDPGQLTTNSLPPVVLIGGVVADSVSVPLLRDAEPGPLRAAIPAGAFRIQVDYTGLSFAAPENVRFQFQMEGLDEHWIEAGARRTAYFNRLAPGDYTFIVRACNNDGVWTEADARLALHVQPWWWQTVWFRLGSVLGLIAGGIAVFLKVHRLRLRRALERAEQRNAELRAAELDAANRKLEARTHELEEALTNVRTLRGLIPICAYCKKIRDDRGFWEQVEGYVQKHSEAKFTHGLCPECLKKHFGKFADPAPPSKPVKTETPPPPQTGPDSAA